MTTLINRFLFVLPPALMIAALPGSAQPRPDKADWHNLEQLTPGVGIRVERTDHKSVRGQLQSAAGDSLAVNTRDGQETLPRSLVARVWTERRSHRRQNARKGLLWGLAVGAGSGVLPTVALAEFGASGWAAAALPVFAAAGAGAGAAVGALAPTGGWQEVYRARADASGAELVGRYLEAAQIQQAAARGEQMEADFDARLPKLEREGHLRAQRRISGEGQISYQVLDSSGDSAVRREVIDRYLAAESGARDTGAAAITPANYEFRLKGSLGPEEQRVYAFQLTPRRKKIGLFKGELWVDGQTGMPVRESGEFVKSPSVFVKRITFVRTYELRDGVALPEQMESTAETRVAGRAELVVRYTNFVKPCQPSLISTAR